MTGLALGGRYSYPCLIDTKSDEVIEEARLRIEPGPFEQRFSGAHEWPEERREGDQARTRLLFFT